MYCGIRVYEKLDGMSAWLLGFIALRELLHIYEVLSMIVEEFLEEGRELPAGNGLVITEGTAVAVTR
jgi:hypothetical protein